ncbi:UNVERIFIED_CONTAM: hypothetical protein K2H54_052617 [Gekko kuhli]
MDRWKKCKEPPCTEEDEEEDGVEPATGRFREAAREIPPRPGRDDSGDLGPGGVNATGREGCKAGKSNSLACACCSTQPRNTSPQSRHRSTPVSRKSSVHNEECHTLSLCSTAPAKTNSIPILMLQPSICAMITVKFKVQNVPYEMEVHTESALSIISMSTFHCICPKSNGQCLKPFDLILYDFQGC